MTTCQHGPCHHLLTPRQVKRGNRFCGRRCANLAVCAVLWSTPAARQKQAEAVRRGKMLDRLDRWAQPAYETLLGQLDADKMTRRELAAIKVVLADLSRAMYQAGYRCGYSTRLQREITGRDQRRRAA